MTTHRLTTSRFAIFSIGVLAASGLALTACSTANSTTPAAGASSAAPSVAPAAALAKAFAQLKANGYDVTLSQQGGQLTGTGSIDPGKSASMHVKGTVQGVGVELQAIAISDALYAKIDLGPMSSSLGIDPTKWLKIDNSKVTQPPFDLATGDAFDVTSMLTTVSDVTATDAQHISGTVDLTKATGVSAPASSELSSAGDAAKTVKFTATLDDQGRLADLKLDAGSAQALNMEFQFSNYGSPSPVTAPTGSVPASDAIYQFLNS